MGATSQTDAGIMALVMRGLSDQEIASALDLSEAGVGRRIARLCAEVGSRNRVALASTTASVGSCRGAAPADGASPS